MRKSNTRACRLILVEMVPRIARAVETTKCVDTDLVTYVDRRNALIYI